MWPRDDSRSAELFLRAQRVLPGGISRLQTWIDPYPIYARSGAGSIVTDVDGVERVDFHNNFASLIHGHAHPRVVEAVARQLCRGSVYAMPTEVEIELAELVCERIESANLIRFCNSGTEAVMLAMKAARANTGRPVIAKLEGAYHGMYDYAEVSLDAAPENWGNRPTPVAFAKGTPRAVLDDSLVLPFNDVATARTMLREAGERLAGILVDPSPAMFGMVPMSKEFADMLRAVADELGAVLICDEVIALRLGYHGAQARVGLRPDLTVLGKIIGGGFPVGAVCGSSSAMAVFSHREGKPRNPSSGTFTANPITMTAGLETMRLIDEAAYAKLDALGEHARRVIGSAFEEAGFPGQVTGVGGMFHLYTHERPVHDYRSSRSTEGELAMMKQLHRELTEAGYLIASRGACFLSTANTIEQLDAFADVLAGCLRRLG